MARELRERKRRKAQHPWVWEPYKGYRSSKSVRVRRGNRAAEAGFSEREIEIIYGAYEKFEAKKWKKVLVARKEATVSRANKDGHSIPSKADWRLYRAGLKVKRVRNTFEWEVADRIITSWMKAAKKVDVERGNVSIIEIFNEWGGT